MVLGGFRWFWLIPCFSTYMYINFIGTYITDLIFDFQPLTRIILVAAIGPLHDPVTWHGINYAGTQVTQWDF